MLAEIHDKYQLLRQEKGAFLCNLLMSINAAARLVCSARKFDHMTPLLCDFQRIEFKLAVLATGLEMGNGKL